MLQKVYDLYTVAKYMSYVMLGIKIVTKSVRSFYSSNALHISYVTLGMKIVTKSVRSFYSSNALSLM